MKLDYQKIVDKVQVELDSVLDSIDEKDTRRFVEMLVKSKRIFLLGSGRSKLVCEAFAMRLVQMGKAAYVIGEPTSPNLCKKDLLIVVSGSGKTKVVNEAVSLLGSRKLLVISGGKSNPLAKKSDFVIVVKGRTKSGKVKSIEPLGSLFEQSVFLYLDFVILLLMKKLKKTEKDLSKAHSKIL